MSITSLLRTSALGAVLAAVAACGGSSGDTPAADVPASSSTETPATATTPTDSALPVASAIVDGVDGAAIYPRCIACHQANGTGLPGAFPPLAGSEWATGPAEVPIRIVLHGLQGPITVAGTEYNSVMMPYGGTGEMNDAEVAAVLTYVRSSFGNSASPVTSAEVAAVRAQTAGRTTGWTADELKPLLK
jgi:mono/diheme cytochrome c family protein